MVLGRAFAAVKSRMDGRQASIQRRAELARVLSERLQALMGNGRDHDGDCAANAIVDSYAKCQTPDGARL